MNAYLIDAGEVKVHFCIDYKTGCYEETDRAIAIMISPTRGKAKASFLAIPAYRYKLEWTSPMTIRILAKDITLPEGLSDAGFLWRMARKRGLIHDF